MGSLVFELLKAAQQLARDKYHVTNILQPGVIKELLMAEILGHELIPSKNSADAKDKQGGTYEYLASIRRINVASNRGCSFQLDRVTPKNLRRVTRNNAFYFGIFLNHLEVQEIWRVEIPVVLEEVKRQLANCKNDIAHVNFLLKWLQNNGKKVYP